MTDGAVTGTIPRSTLGELRRLHARAVEANERIMLALTALTEATGYDVVDWTLDALDLDRGTYALRPRADAAPLADEQNPA